MYLKKLFINYWFKASTFSNLTKYLSTGITVLHFSCHGAVERNKRKDTSRGYLLFEDEDRVGFGLQFYKKK